MRVPKNIVDARRGRLHDLIRRDGFVPLSEICRVLGISEATARRDIQAITKEGRITRMYGGALADFNSTFASLEARGRWARGGKASIAQLAYRQIPMCGTVYLDAGTTVLALARLIARRKKHTLTVVTNSIAVASVVGGAPGITLYLLGGVYLHRQATLFGEAAVAALKKWTIDAAFLGAQAMNRDGIWNSHSEVVELQRGVLPCALKSYFLIDRTKLGRTTPYSVAAWPNSARLITDAPYGELTNAGVHAAHDRILTSA
jgi:DeoR/GlpR family transcriptional regulator of sugar metabolism